MVRITTQFDLDRKKVLLQFLEFYDKFLEKNPTTDFHKTDKTFISASEIILFEMSSNFYTKPKTKDNSFTIDELVKEKYLEEKKIRDNRTFRISLKGVIFIKDELIKDREYQIEALSNTERQKATPYYFGDLKRDDLQKNQVSKDEIKHIENVHSPLNVWLKISEHPIISSVIAAGIVFIVGSYIHWNYPDFPCWKC